MEINNKYKVKINLKEFDIIITDINNSEISYKLKHSSKQIFTANINNIYVIQEKTYYIFEVKQSTIKEIDGMTIISSSSREVPCSYNFAKQKAEKQRKLINIIDNLRKS